MNRLTESIGFIGALFLGFCAVPEVYLALTTGKTGLSWSFLSIWQGGEIMLLIYTLMKSKEVKLWPLFLNYGANIILIGIIMAVKGRLI